MKDKVKQELGKQTVERPRCKTAYCFDVWTLLNAIRDANKDPDFVGTKTKIDELLEQLETAFTDFECSWTEHAKEYHS